MNGALAMRCTRALIYIHKRATSLACHTVQENEAFVRIKLASCDTLKSKVLTLKQDLKYWPTW